VAWLQDDFDASSARETIKRYDISSMSDAELPAVIRYMQAFGGPTTVSVVAATVSVVAAVTASVFQYRMWRLSKDKLRLDLSEQRLKIYKALHMEIARRDGDITKQIDVISDVITRLEGYRLLFSPEVVKIIGSIELRLMLLSSKLKSYEDGFDVHRFVISALGDIDQEKRDVEPLLVKQLSFVN
jgi:hypothetical protein